MEGFLLIVKDIAVEELVADFELVGELPEEAAQVVTSVTEVHHRRNKA